MISSLTNELMSINAPAPKQLQKATIRSPNREVSEIHTGANRNIDPAAIDPIHAIK